MAVSTHTQPPEQQAGKPPRSARERGRTAALVVLAILITIFAVLNLDEVKVHWIIGSGHAPLIIVIVVSLLVGMALSHFSKLRFRRRR